MVAKFLLSALAPALLSSLALCGCDDNESKKGNNGKDPRGPRERDGGNPGVRRNYGGPARSLVNPSDHPSHHDPAKPPSGQIGPQPQPEEVKKFRFEFLVESVDGVQKLKRGQFAVGEVVKFNGVQFKILENGKVSTEVPVIWEDQVKYTDIKNGEQETKTIDLDSGGLQKLVADEAFVDVKASDGSDRVRVSYPAPEGLLEKHAGWFVSELRVKDSPPTKNPSISKLKSLTKEIVIITGFFPKILELIFSNNGVEVIDLDDVPKKTIKVINDEGIKISYGGQDFLFDDLPDEVLNAGFDKIRFFSDINGVRPILPAGEDWKQTVKSFRLYSIPNDNVEHKKSAELTGITLG